MSIYGTGSVFFLPHPNEGDDELPVRVMEQIVPAWVDFECAYLPPPRAEVSEDDGYSHPRAIVYVTDDCDKGGEGFGGQQYHTPLLVLSGIEWEQLSFPEVMRRLDDALETYEGLGRARGSALKAEQRAVNAGDFVAMMSAVARANPEQLRLVAQLLGCAPCPVCDYVRAKCRCSPQPPEGPARQETCPKLSPEPWPGLPCPLPAGHEGSCEVSVYAITACQEQFQRGLIAGLKDAKQILERVATEEKKT